MKKISEIFLNISIAVISFILIFCLLEVSANIYLLYWANEARFVRYASWQQLQKRRKMSNPQYSPHRYIGYYPTPNYVNGKNRHNSYGYRGKNIAIPKPNEQFRIFCLGGSTTYTYNGAAADYGESWPDLIEKYLIEKGIKNVQVINAGADGWSSWESLIDLELKILDLEPDMIIIYHGINDIHPRFVWPQEAYRGDNSGRRAFGNLSFMPSMLEYSTLLRILMIRAGLIAPHAAFDRTIDENIPDSFYGNLFIKQKNEGVYPQGIFKDISALKMLKTNTPVYFERNIRNMIAIAKNYGVKIVISSFAYSSLFTPLVEVSSEEYIFAHEENNLLLKRISEDTGVYFFDFASKFPKSKRYYYDGRHVNLEGAKLQAEFFGNFLIENRLISSSNEPN
ncbi:MAG: SGNH/GDSL hydrolase family protein [Nitrospirae bacterium]|nr:SGNH/GDSL hydrolase family protein [Nitrospirota bacterium]